MKNILIIFLTIFVLSCQREVKNELGLGYNKTLIIPPSNDLPTPNTEGTNNNFNNNNFNNNNFNPSHDIFKFE